MCRKGDKAALGDDQLIGTTIDNRYLIEARLGEGGMGVVYRARHVILNKSVAIKVLRKAHEESAWKRFVQEAQSASMINHSNVVAITDFGVISGHAYLVMEFLEGQTLTEAINDGPLSPLRVCRIGAQIARGLQAVHDKGIVHRDLKPDNIFLLEREGKPDIVKIVDFGLAKWNAGERLTQDGTVVGTAEYISPEQVTGQDTDHRSDQYSLGCILYEMLTTQLPFEGESTATLIYKHVYKTPQAPRKVRPEMKIPPSVEAVVLKCMAKKPQDRFPSMRELEQALTLEEQYLAPIESTGNTLLVRPRPLTPPAWVRWLVLGVLGSLVLLLLVTLVQRVPLHGAGTPQLADLSKATVVSTPVDPLAQKRPQMGDLPHDGGTSTGPTVAVKTLPEKQPVPNTNGTVSNPAQKPVNDDDDDAAPETASSSKPPRNRGGRSSTVVRFSIEPAAVAATVTCKSRRSPCKGSCVLHIASGASCQVTARGFNSRTIRFRDLKNDRGKRSYRVVLAPLKL